jgi:DNA-3-methyladenine glycosylase II
VKGVLDERSFAAAVAELCEADPDLAAIVDEHGVPEFWARVPGFPSLVLLILEQQVSLASARAAYDRLVARLGGLSPQGVLDSTDEELRADGFSRQKNRYVRALAAALEAGALDLDAVAALDDAEVRTALVALPGIGPWTADYLAMRVLGNPDILLSSDLVVRQAAVHLGLPGDVRGLDARGAAWSPWRSYATVHLWRARP